MREEQTFEIKDGLDKLLEQYFWLAYQACGGTAGMGCFQAKFDATPEQVLHNVETDGDYPGAKSTNRYYGDYVFGRMMKLGIHVEGDRVTLPACEPQLSYQAWARVYPTYTALFNAAAEASGATVAVV